MALCRSANFGAQHRGRMVPADQPESHVVDSHVDMKVAVPSDNPRGSAGRHYRKHAIRPREFQWTGRNRPKIEMVISPVNL
jgi:hypothetical protein